jgi:arsenate reductase
MAEGILNHLGFGKWEAQSAGIIPSYVHPLAIHVMKEINIEIDQQTSKSLNQFLNEKFDYVITLCDYAAMSCPTFPGRGKRIHWSIEDPVGVTGTMEKRLVIFRKVRDKIRSHIGELLKSESQPPPSPHLPPETVLSS